MLHSATNYMLQHVSNYLLQSWFEANLTIILNCQSSGWAQIPARAGLSWLLKSQGYPGTTAPPHHHHRGKSTLSCSELFSAISQLSLICCFSFYWTEAGISKNSDRIPIKIKMPNPSQEPPAPTKDTNKDLKDMDILCKLNFKIESWNSEYGCNKDQ